MKNKKLVATVASLCLVVVAVVAAVVGVFAAVTQNASATFNVTYTARNVYATVSLHSKGPSLSTGDVDPRSYAVETQDSEGSTGWEQASGTVTHTFMPGNPTNDAATSSAVASVNLSGKAYDFGWDSASNSQHFLGKAVYRFTFTNNATNGDTLANSANKLNVSYAFSGSEVNSNLEILFYTPKTTQSPDLAISDITAQWDASGDLETGFGLGTTNFTALGANSGSLSPIDVGASGYLFMVLIVKDMQKDVNLSVINNNLTFTLLDTRTA